MSKTQRDIEKIVQRVRHRRWWWVYYYRLHHIVPKVLFVVSIAAATAVLGYWLLK